MADSTDESRRNKAVVRRVFEAIFPDPDGAKEFGELVAADFTDHDPIVPDRARGADSLQATHAALHQRFAGRVHFTIDAIVAENDMVAVRWSIGPMQAMAWFRLRDGKLTDRWAIARMGSRPQ